MAYTPSVQDLAEIVRRARERLAEMYPPADGTMPQIQLPPVQVQGPPSLDPSDPLSQSGLPWTNQVPSNPGNIPLPQGGGVYTPTGVTKTDPRTGVTTPITPTDRMVTNTIPPLMAKPGASATFGFPTQPGSPLQANMPYVPAPAGYASGVPQAGAGAGAGRLADTVAPPVAGQPQQMDPGMGRTADLSLPPGFLDKYNADQARNRSALGALALQSGAFALPGAPTSLADAFNQAIPQPAQTAQQDQYSIGTNVAGPMPLARRLT